MKAARPRRARVKALAKINLSLKVLGKRLDGFHELRTIFQTISLGDEIELEYCRSSSTGIDLSSNLDIDDNLAVRAAAAVMDASGRSGHIRIALKKRIPVGGGMGGGSSDAAAVLLALPVLAGAALPLDRLAELAAALGSDVPFFLHGGAALGIGRGAELYPLPDAPRFHGLAVFPPVAISTAEAYRGLSRELTADFESFTMSKFQALSWALASGLTAEAWEELSENDFEEWAWSRRPELAAVRRKLARLGAKPVMLSGSGSSLFGIFPDRGELERALARFQGDKIEMFHLVSRRHYRRMWWRSLRAFIDGETWPPRSRYAG
ncbi:MAG: 4-(cytidine 5'-diphospho)-2-C-methyl-D-erythritol kinase [Bryobacteraceae bacterium]|nr:4-(cytidine 5'-diphospho)-2-C-methyl-D-erythritol kinase [Bryobacteraceae bacterium]